ncbi:hypothetical protein AVEN_185692-1 [Araneus ventricosus]|uniref:Uncharacterized protein n=1 Tax=Araneus ventricosus TaxID=182803 RepID=A0A4Y2QD29_ARAVE|nr:hypothetical protein AVEN_185692-1 [Araneus ventricosus]
MAFTPWVTLPGEINSRRTSPIPLMATILATLSSVVSYSTCSSPQLDQVRESARPQKIPNQRRTFKEGRPRWPSDKASTPAPEGRRLETRFHRRSAVYGARRTLNNT